MHLRPTARALSFAALVAAAVPLALARCSYSFECDSTSAAIMLPAPGDTVELRVRACIDPGPDATPLFGLRVVGTDPGGAPVRVTLIDPSTGDDLADPDNPGIESSEVTRGAARYCL